MLLSQGERDYCRDTMLAAKVWVVGTSETFASGVQANNKLLFERLRTNDPAGYEWVLHQMGELIKPYGVQGLWGVPSGGQDIAVDLGQKLELPVVKLRKEPVAEPGKKRFQYASEEDQKAAASIERLAGLEDVPNRFTSFLGALALGELAQHTRVLAGAFGRGAAHFRERVAAYPVELLVDEYIPDVLRPHDQFWWAHKHQAVGSLQP